MFRHPKYYKELRRRNKADTIKRRVIPGRPILDQAISDEVSTEATSVRPGPGLQVTSYKYPGPRPISNANKGLIHKRQASSPKLLEPQAASVKPQA